MKIIFDTSQNSWHGLSRPINLPKNVYRKSIAIYYLCKPEKRHLNNKRALFAPREHQKKSKDVLELIKIREQRSEKLFHKAYIQKNSLNLLFISKLHSSGKPFKRKFDSIIFTSSRKKIFKYLQ